VSPASQKLQQNMASSPPGSATSPPPTGPQLSLPKKRPSITIPNQAPAYKRRKPSNAGSSTHPLRQTSFPPPDGPGREYSPDTQASQAAYSPISRRSDSLDIDDEINSVVSGRTNNTTHNKKDRAPKGKKVGKVGRPPKNRGDTASLIDGDGTRKGTSTNTPNNEDAPNDDGNSEDEEDGGDDVNTLEGGKLTKAAMDAEKERKAMFSTHIHPAHAEIYETWNRIHLKKEVVRRLANQTLSQSVPASVVTTINSYTKVFVGEIVDRAREVQKEWLAAAEKLPTGEKNEEAFGKDGEGEPMVRERDRGPLLPDHLREALRRYKHDRFGGTVGFTGISLEGRESAAVRNGGRRLFR
jgi:transcription initiation factor TFIID subunit 11